jgi:predicted Zn-ribbon and HTH transcriptional regulator
MNLLVDAWQQGQLHQTQLKANAAARVAEKSKELATDLHARTEALALANQALFELMAERFGLKEEDVLRRMAEIDQRDGRSDGKIGGKPVACRKCGRTTNTARKACVFCGEPVVDGHLFQKI